MYGIFTYISHKKAPHVGKYTSPMDGMGHEIGGVSETKPRNDSPGYRWHWPRPRPKLGRWGEGRVSWNGTFQQVLFCISSGKVI